MNSREVFAIIDKIAAESSKTAKQALIAQHIDDNLFRQVLVAALDPFVTYGIAKLPERTMLGNEAFYDGGETFALLIDLAKRKLTGNAARQAVQDEINRLDASSATLFGRILLKDLRAGFSESTVNKARPGLISTFECALAHPFEEKRVKSWPQVVEPKLDGVRVLAFVDEEAEKAGFYSRSGKEFTTFDHLKEPLIRLVREACPGTQMVFDGEIVSGSFNNTVSEVRRSSAQASDATFHMFDVLERVSFDGEDAKGFCTGSGVYLDRRTHLEQIIANRRPDDPVVAVPRYLVNGVQEIHSFYDRFRARGLEGVIVKEPNALYRRRRDHAWMKIKAEESVDVPIIDAEEGTGKYAGMLGALIVAFDAESHKNGADGANHDTPGAVRVNIGTGLSDYQRKTFWEAYLADKAAERTSENVSNYSLLHRVIEVGFHEITPDGSLRHPRFERFRDDKDMRKAA